MTDERELELLRPVLMAAAREIEPCGGLHGGDDDALAVLCILRATKAAIDEFQNVRRSAADLVAPRGGFSFDAETVEAVRDLLDEVVELVASAPVRYSPAQRLIEEAKIRAEVLGDA